MVIVTARLEVKPEDLEAAVAASLVHVHRSRNEPGCISHSINQDAENPNQLLFLELWQDKAALAAHFAVPEARDFSRQIAGMAVARTELALYEGEPFTP
jgi:quinol monooxygenase YgiN